MSAADWFGRLRTGEGLRSGWAGPMQIVNGLLAAGVPEPTIRGCLLEPSNEGVRYLHFDSAGRPRPRATTERFVRSALAKARRHQEESTGFVDRAAALAFLAGIRASVDDEPGRWKGRGGASDRAVLLAALDLAMERGATTFGASVRQLADGANIGVKAAFSSIGRLSDWLEVIERGAGTRASTLRLRGRHGNARGRHGDPLCPRRTEPEGCDDVRTTADVWRWGAGALGKSTAYVYAQLGASPRSTADLAAALDVDPRTVRRHLAKMREHQLAITVLDGWIRGPADPDDVADAIGVAGRGAAQRQAHSRRVALRRLALEHMARPRERTPAQHKRTPRQRSDAQWWATWWGSLGGEVFADAA